MKKYVSPEMNFQEIASSDTILLESEISKNEGFVIDELNGFDTEGSKSALFDAEFWFE
jgi:hypothetical protein